MTLFIVMSILLLAAGAVTAAKDAASQYPESVPYVVTAISSTIAGLSAYLIGRKKSSKSEFTELVAANKKFRDEIKVELDAAKATIEKMQKALEEEGKLIDELRTQIADLKQQIIAKETKISDLQMDMIKKDYQIQMLQK